MSSGGVCERLDWDSEFFGCRIARVTLKGLNEDGIRRVLAWCRSQQVDCLYFLADVEDERSRRIAEENHFRQVGVRMTLERRVEQKEGGGSEPPQGIRQHRADDIPALRAIAGVSHRDTRFYQDPHFPEGLCSALYRHWIERSCLGWANMVLVAEWDSKVAGYLSCHLEEGGDGRIGLFAVAEEFRGRGLGWRLVAGALDWFGRRGTDRVKVVTQGRNWRAQQLYRRCGFVPRKEEVWYHRWFEPGEALGGSE